MKKVGAFLVLFLLLFSLVPLALSDNHTADDTDDDDTDDDDTSSSSTSSQQNPDKIEEGFECLEDKAEDCSDLSTQEVALTILATPDNIFNDCVIELEDRQANDHWGNVRDTAMAILALKHAGEDTAEAEEWLLEQERTPTDLVWYMQQDSNDETECQITYDDDRYDINVNTNKKIDANAGSCLTRAQSNFWLEVSPSCYDEEFSIECDKDFIANLLYRNKQASTIYVLSGTDSSPAFGTIKLNVNSKCFGSGSCDYEATAWATVALLETGHNVEEFIPYVIAMADTNERYLPEAFIYILTNYEDYATKLVTDQKRGDYWEAKNSVHKRFYDTALALIALGSSSSEQITKSRDWLLFKQGENGCWSNSVKDTAIVLWALSGRAGRSSGGSGVTYCSEANYFCIPSNDCSGSEDVGNNYFCASLSDTCCTAENLKSCSEYGGQECASDKVCTGNNRRATDTTDCCTGTCEDRPTETECEANFYTCMDTCSDLQEPMSAYSCDQAQVCCRTKTDEGGSSFWTWFIIILIILILAILAFIFREKLKMLWFKIKTKFKKDKRKGGASRRPRPPMPPRRPGFPPVRRPRPPVAPMRKRSYDKRDPAMSETFKKLREMSR